MALRVINVGTSADDDTGDQLRNAFIKVNDNFEEVPFKDTVEPYTAAQYFAEQTASVIASTYTWDLETQQVLKLTITEDVEISFAEGHNGVTAILILVQDGTGGWDVTWGNDIYFVDGDVPVIPTDPGAMTVVTFIVTSGYLYGNAVNMP